MLDQSGALVFTVDCKNISYIGDGIYFYWNDKRSTGKLINRRGKALPVKLPSEYHLQEVIIPPSKREGVEGQIPDDALFIARKNGLAGIFDYRGNPKIAADYDSFEPLDKYRYTVTKYNSERKANDYFVYDARDNSIVECARSVPEVSSTAETLYPFQTAELNSWGYKKRTTVIIPPQFSYAGSLEGQYAIAYKRTKESTAAFFIDADGKIISPAFKQLKPFCGELAPAMPEGNSDSFGLIDKNFQFILSPQFIELTGITPGIFLAKRTAETADEVVNIFGQTVFELPEDVRSLTALNENLFVATFKDLRQSKSLLVDRTGRTLRTLDYYAVEEAERKLRIAYQMKPGQTIWFGVVNERGEEILPCQSERVEITEPDRILLGVAKAGFNRDCWDDWTNPTRGRNHERVSQFGEFLLQYDLVGMPRPQVYKLLGPGEEHGDIARYSLGPGGCTTVGTMVSLRYDKQDRVSGWCVDYVTAKDLEKHKWITENVVLARTDDYPGYSLIRVIPKSTSSAPRAPQ